MSDKNSTIEQVLKDWDDGNPVWSVELGGIGPGYEQCIQLVGFEFLKQMKISPFDYELNDSNKVKWKIYINTIEANSTAKSLIEKLGPSGAQYEAAMNLASVFSRHGYAKGLKMAGEDRHILVSKNFPNGELT